MVKFAILGPIELRHGGRKAAVGGPRQIALLALMLLNANRGVSSECLTDTLWGGRSSAGADKRLQMAIARLRRALDLGGVRSDAALRTVGGGYLLAVEPGELDADVFETHVDEGTRALEAGEPADAAALLREALAMWRGPVLADVAYEEFAQAEIRRLEEMRLAAVEARVEADLRLGEHAQLVAELEALTASHPMRERMTAQLMLAYYRCGRQADALELYHRTQVRLDLELGLQPGPSLRALQRQILEHAPALELVAPPPPRRRAGAPARTPPIPAALRSQPTSAYVGRSAERARLSELVQEARAGARRVVCVAGEPGVGKTRLAARTALAAHETGFTVAWGTATEGLRPPYGPWMAVLAELVEHAPDEVLRAHVAEHGGELGRLARVLKQRIGGVPAPQRSDPETERYLLFAAVAGLLRALCAIRPVALGLDDMQWADAESLALLQYLFAVTPRDAPLLILIAYRDSDLGTGHPLRGVLANLHQPADSERLLLAGLEEDEVAQLMALRAGHHLDREGRRLAAEITAETGGNPFFVGEILRHLEDSGAVTPDRTGRWHVRGAVADLGLPQTVREVIQWRVQRLGAAAETVLTVAAILGRTFDLDLLERLVDVDDPLAAVEAAMQSAILQPADVPGRYVFVHALIEHTLYEAVGATRRARLHGRIATILEALPDADPAQLAHHAARSSDPAQVARAVRYARLAGERALGQLAPDEALHWFNRALQLAVAHGADDDERCDILVGLGEAKRRVGDPTFRNNLLAASRIATRLGDRERLTRAVLANTLGPFGAAGAADRLRVEALERALRTVDADCPQRARMMAILARELYYGGEPGRGSHLSVAALAHARRGNDRQELARVMALTTAISPIGALDAHAELVEELTALAEQIGDPELRFQAANAGFIYGMHSGDPVPLEAGLNVMLALAAAIRQPIMRWTSLWAHSARRALSGDLPGAEALTMQAAAAARTQRRPQGLLLTFGQLLSIRTEQDRLDEVREQLDVLTARNPRLPILRLARGFVDAETGHLQSAEAMLRSTAAVGFQFPFDRTLAFSLARCADIALRVGAIDVAAELYERMLPHRAQFATPAGISSRGSIELNLGRLASLLGRFDAADAHFHHAERAHERLHAPLLQARTALARGESLLARGDARHGLEVSQLLDRARRLAERHGSLAIRREALALAGTGALASRSRESDALVGWLTR